MELKTDLVHFISGDINQNSVEACQEFLLKNVGEEETLTIFLNSYGGDVYDAFGLYDFMRLLKQRIAVVAMGKVMSSGLIILNGASEGYRLSLDNTRFMMHYADINDNNITGTNIKGIGKNITELNDQMITLFGKHYKTNEKHLRELCARDYYFGVGEAERMGVIDGLL